MRTVVSGLQLLGRRSLVVLVALMLALQIVLPWVPTAHAAATSLAFFNASGQQPLDGIPAQVASVSVNEGILSAVGTDGRVYTSFGINAPVPNIDHVVKAFVARRVGFVIKDDGTLWSWGDGSLIGRINDQGTGVNEDDPNPGQITGLPPLQTISVNADHVLALDTSGHVWAWGQNYVQQLGLNPDCPFSATQRPDCNTDTQIMPQQVPGLSNVQSIQAGYGNSLAVVGDGTPRFWGSICAVETFWPVYPTPSVYPGLEDAKQVLVDDCSMTYLTNSGNVYTLGLEGVSARPPLQVDLPAITSIATDGWDNRVALSTTGVAYRYSQSYSQETSTSTLIRSIGLGATYYSLNPFLNTANGTREQGGVVVAGQATDTTAPVLGTPAWSNNPKATTATTTLTVPATDDASGIARAEYFIGDTDPGQGNGATVTLSNVGNGNLSANLTTTFDTDFPTGVYKISVRAQDAAGNWSAPVSDYLVVYDPAGPKFTGKRTITPSLANGDVLPGLISPTQTDTAKFGFSVQYNNQGQIKANSDFQFSYSTGTKCNNPAKAVNCHNLDLNASSIAWLTTQGTNLSTGIFQGTGALTVDGTASTVTFRVTGVDGTRLSPTANDQFQVQIFNQSDSPNTATPLYRVNLMDISRGNIRIN